MRFTVILSLALLGLSGQPVKTALEQASDLEQRVQSAAKAGNHTARISADIELFRLLNGSPAAIEALARAYAASGDSQKALAALNQFADLGLADEGLLDGSDHRYAAIQNLPEFRQVLARFSANEAPVSLSKVAFTMPDPGLIPEDIDYDSRSKSFLATSILERKIVRVRTDGSVADFAPSPDNWSMVAIKIDGLRNRAWATEVAFEGFAQAPKSAWGHSAVLCFDLGSGRLLQRIDGPLHSSLGDMTLAPHGEPIVSDNDKGTLYRISNGRMVEINKMDFISPQTAIMIPDGDQLFVPDYTRGIGRLDLRTKRVQWLNPNGVDRVALTGIDGLYLYGHTLIATQNGTSPERVIQLELDPSLSHVILTKVVEQSASSGCDPTHGVIVGNSFYYIANSGWARLDEHGNVRPGIKLSSALIMRYNLVP
jgi:hypothetical protein